MRSGREAGHSSPLRFEVKNTWRHTPPPHNSSCGSAYLSGKTNFISYCIMVFFMHCDETRTKNLNCESGTETYTSFH
jgi:hypothetical protein